MYNDIVKNRVFEFFSNSFLVECTDAKDVGKVTFASMSSERTIEYRIATRFTADGNVEKYALDDSGKPHILQVLKNEEQMRARGLKVCESRVVEGALVTDFVHAESAEKKVLEAGKKGDKEQVYFLLDQLYENIRKASEIVPEEQNIIYSFELDTVANAEKYGEILETGYIDMILRNAFLIDGEYVWFDQEWTLENVPAKYVLYRALGELYHSFPELQKSMPMEEVAEHYGLLECWDIFKKVEGLFIQTVMDQKHFIESAQIRGGDRAACISNIKKIMNI